MDGARLDAEGFGHGQPFTIKVFQEPGDCGGDMRLLRPVFGQFHPCQVEHGDAVMHRRVEIAQVDADHVGRQCEAVDRCGMPCQLYFIESD